MPSLQELVDAAKANDAEGVSTLLALGAPVDDKKSGKAPVLTPLCAAAENGSLEILKALLDAGADPNAVTSQGNYPLRAAILSGDGPCIGELVSRGADVRLETARGTPLIAASAEGDCSTIDLLLDKGAQVDYESRDGVTALMAAAQHDRREAVRVLLRRGADPARRHKDGGHTAVDIAQEKGLAEVYSLLMQFSVTSAADRAIAESEARQKAAAVAREEDLRVEKEKMDAESATNRAQVNAKVSELQAEKEELMRRLGIKR